MTNKKVIIKEGMPSCSYNCDVMNKCVYHYVPVNKEYSLDPKYCGENGCVFFSEVEFETDIKILRKPDPKERFYDVI